MKPEIFTSEEIVRHASSADLASPICELSLLLPRHQLVALQRIGCRNGLTTGALLRRLVGDFLHEQEPGRSQTERRADGLELKRSPRRRLTRLEEKR
jgi:hypothetical protein